MELKQILDKQYSNSKLNTSNYSNSTVDTTTVLDNLTDLVPNQEYRPWYIKQLKLLGYKRFMELAQKARAGSDTPHILFRWMIKNNKLVV